MMMNDCVDKCKTEYVIRRWSGVAYADVGDDGIEEGEREPSLVFKCEEACVESLCSRIESF
jgi:hypothetical protein